MIFDFHAHLRRNAQSHQYEIEEQLEDMRANHIAYRVLSTFEGASMASANDAVIALHRQYPQIIPVPSSIRNRTKPLRKPAGF